MTDQTLSLDALTYWNLSSSRDLTTVDELESWALPIILHVEKDAHIYHEDAVTAAARGVATLLGDDRSAFDPEWRQAISSWMQTRIRKVSRRARGTRWEEVNSLPGINVTEGNAEVRVLLPHLVSETPVAVSRLQVSGLNLERRGVSERPQSLAIALNPDVNMSTGKCMAQAGHIAHLGVLQFPLDVISAWADEYMSVSLTSWDSGAWDVNVEDAGFTEVEPGTETARGKFTLL
jgi:peptidyl-tRNA hydrolase